MFSPYAAFRFRSFKTRSGVVSSLNLGPPETELEANVMFTLLILGGDVCVSTLLSTSLLEL